MSQARCDIASDTEDDSDAEIGLMESHFSGEKEPFPEEYVPAAGGIERAIFKIINYSVAEAQVRALDLSIF